MTERMRIGNATVSMSQTRRNGALEIEVVLDCKHSTTTAYAVEPDPRHPRLHDRDLIQLVCEKHLAETPCACVRTVLAQYEVRF